LKEILFLALQKIKFGRAKALQISILYKKTTLFLTANAISNCSASKQIGTLVACCASSNDSILVVSEKQLSCFSKG